MDKQREAFDKWLRQYHADHFGEESTSWDVWQAAQQAQWLPIETAPRDGRPILCGWSNGEEPCVCYWREIVSEWSGWHGYPEFDDQPTHWMPLPPEPKP